ARLPPRRRRTASRRLPPRREGAWRPSGARAPAPRTGSPRGCASRSPGGSSSPRPRPRADRRPRRGSDRRRSPRRSPGSPPCSWPGPGIPRRSGAGAWTPPDGGTASYVNLAGHLRTRRSVAGARRPLHLPPDDRSVPGRPTVPGAPRSMPVFTRIKHDVLVLTADGAYTAGELERVGARALASAEAAAPLLLDLSGAAGLEGKDADEIAAAGRAIAGLAAHVTRLAVVVGSRHAPRFDGESDRARAAGVPARACPSHADALAWLGESAPADPRAATG